MRLNPILSPLASVYNVNGMEKSGKAKMGAVISFLSNLQIIPVVGNACEIQNFSSGVVVAVQQELNSS